MSNTLKRLSPQIIKDDTNAMTGLLSKVPDYATERPEATLDVIRTAYDEMVRLQDLAIQEAEAARKTANAAREAEMTFHKSVVAMREVVRGRYGSDSLEARSVGLVRTSERKSPKSRNK